jgi:hypothetical protein
MAKLTSDTRSNSSQPAPSSTLARQSPGSDHYKWIALSNTTIGMLMATINSSIILISMPAIFTGIGINPLAPGETNYFLWLLLGYMVVTATLVVAFGRISDMLGRVKLYNLGFAIFTLGSLLLFLTPDPGERDLAGARVPKPEHRRRRFRHCSLERCLTIDSRACWRVALLAIDTQYFELDLGDLTIQTGSLNIVKRVLYDLLRVAGGTAHIGESQHSPLAKILVAHLGGGYFKLVT